MRIFESLSTGPKPAMAAVPFRFISLNRYPLLRCMSGTNQKQARCVALQGERRVDPLLHL